MHPNFNAIFTSNSIEYAGVHRPQDALLDRMIGVYMDYYDKETEAKIVAAQSGIKDEHALAIVDMLHTLREKSPQEDLIGTRAGVMIAQALKMANKYDKQSVKQLLADVITSKTKNIQHYNEKMKILEKL